MVKMLGTKDGRTFLGIGLSYSNLERLKAGRPIHFNAEEMHLPAIAVSDVIIFAGETEDSMRDELQQAGALDGTRILEDQRVSQ